MWAFPLLLVFPWKYFCHATGYGVLFCTLFRTKINVHSMKHIQNMKRGKQTRVFFPGSLLDIEIVIWLLCITLLSFVGDILWQSCINVYVCDRDHLNENFTWTFFSGWWSFCWCILFLTTWRLCCIMFWLVWTLIFVHVSGQSSIWSKSKYCFACILSRSRSHIQPLWASVKTPSLLLHAACSLTKRHYWCSFVLSIRTIMPLRGANLDCNNDNNDIDRCKSDFCTNLLSALQTVSSMHADMATLQCMYESHATHPFGIMVCSAVTFDKDEPASVFSLSAHWNNYSVKEGRKLECLEQLMMTSSRKSHILKPESVRMGPDFDPLSNVGDRCLTGKTDVLAFAPCITPTVCVSPIPNVVSPSWCDYHWLTDHLIACFR